MIRTENLTKVFRTPRKNGLWRTRWEEKEAVRDLSLEIPAGRITGLLGVNGAGKTTTIKMLSTLLVPTSGSGSVDGMDLVRDAVRIRPLVNMITGGERALYWRLSARENLWYFGELYDVEPRVLRARIPELLERVGLTEAADTPVERYSKGMKQRLQIARGLINQPRYLFMDEPTLGLDAPIARQLRRMTKELAEVHGCGILLTSHYMFEVEELCDFIYVVDHGRLVSTGTPAQLKSRVIAERRTRLVIAGAMGQAEIEAMLRLELPPDTHVTVEPAEEGTLINVQAKEEMTALLVERFSRLGCRILRAESLEPTLEDAIVALAERSAVPA
jgi:ABC-2 type transport system ATP-binding protein